MIHNDLGIREEEISLSAAAELHPNREFLLDFIKTVLLFQKEDTTINFGGVIYFEWALSENKSRIITR